MRRDKSKVDARGVGRVNVVVVCDRAGVNYEEVIVGERVKEIFAGGAAVLATPRKMVAVEVARKEDGIVRGNGLQEIVKVEIRGESGWGAVDRNQEKIALERLDRGCNTFKVMEGGVDVD